MFACHLYYGDSAGCSLCKESYAIDLNLEKEEGKVAFNLCSLQFIASATNNFGKL